MKTQRGPRLIIVTTCAGCEFHEVLPHDRRYCRALNGSRMDHDGVHEDCPHLGALGTLTQASAVVGLRHQATEDPS